MNAYVGPYRWSGQVGLGGLIAYALTGLLLFPVLAWLYIVIEMNVPYVKLSLLIMLVFGFAAGGILAGISKAFKIRNWALLVVSTLLFALYFEAFSWLFWVHRIANMASGEGGEGVSFLDILLNPLGVLEFVQKIAETGYYTIGRSSSSSSAESGIFVYIGWLGEALCVMGFIIGTPLVMAKDRIFCESTSEWIDDIEDIGPFATIPQEQPFRDRILAGDMGAFETLFPLTEVTGIFVVVKAARTKNDPTFCVLKVVEMTPKVDKDGKVTFAERQIVRPMHATEEAYTALKSLVKRRGTIPLPDQAPAGSTPGGSDPSAI